MTEQYLIGVDIGTQGVKVGVFKTDGTCVSEGHEASQLYQPSPGMTEENPDFQVESMCRVISQCITSASADPKDVAALAIDGQMAGVIGIGYDGLAVTPYDSWLDTRCAPYIEVMRNKAGDEITRKTGNPPSFNHGPKKLWWMNERPDVFQKIARFVQPGGYAAMRLCGLRAEDAFIDETYLHFSGFADNRKSIWDKALCDQFDLPMDKLPKIVKPTEVVGTITSKMAEKCGLGNSVQVIAGCGDTAASFLACGATEEGICVDVAGTASVFAATTRDFRPDTGTGTLGIGRSATPDLWHPYAYINGGGMNLEWFRKEIASIGGKYPLSFAELDRDMSSIEPTLNLPYFIPHMAGRVSPGQPALKGAFVGLDWTHRTSHLYRAMMEGVALEYGIYKNVLTRLYADLDLKQIRITGGGQNSTAWNRIKSGVLGIPVLKIKESIGAPLGAALLAGFGVGLFDSVSDTAAKWVKTGEEIEESETLRGYYRKRTERYEKLINTINDFMEDVQTNE